MLPGTTIQQCTMFTARQLHTHHHAIEVQACMPHQAALRLILPSSCAAAPRRLRLPAVCQQCNISAPPLPAWLPAGVQTWTATSSRIPSAT